MVCGDWAWKSERPGSHVVTPISVSDYVTLRFGHGFRSCLRLSLSVPYVFGPWLVTVARLCAESNPRALISAVDPRPTKNFTWLPPLTLHPHAHALLSAPGFGVPMFQIRFPNLASIWRTSTLHIHPHFTCHKKTKKRSPKPASQVWKAMSQWGDNPLSGAGQLRTRRRREDSEYDSTCTCVVPPHLTYFLLLL